MYNCAQCFLAYITHLLGICFTATFFLWPTDPRLDETPLADDWQVGRRLNRRKQNVRNFTDSGNTTTFKEQQNKYIISTSSISNDNAPTVHGP